MKWNGLPLFYRISRAFGTQASPENLSNSSSSRQYLLESHCRLGWPSSPPAGTCSEPSDCYAVTSSVALTLAMARYVVVQFRISCRRLVALEVFVSDV